MKSRRSDRRGAAPAGQRGNRLSADDWPAFRGPAGNGISTEKSAPTTWAADKNIKWKVALPQPGNGSPIVSNGRVFIAGSEDKEGKKRSLALLRPEGRQAGLGEDDRVRQGDADPRHQHALPSTPAVGRQERRGLARLGRTALLRLRGQGALVARPGRIRAHVGRGDLAGDPRREGLPELRAREEEGLRRGVQSRERQDDLGEGGALQGQRRTKTRTSSSWAPGARRSSSRSRARTRSICAMPTRLRGLRAGGRQAPLVLRGDPVQERRPGLFVARASPGTSCVTSAATAARGSA